MTFNKLIIKKKTNLIQYNNHIMEEIKNNNNVIPTEQIVDSGVYDFGKIFDELLNNNTSGKLWIVFGYDTKKNASVLNDFSLNGGSSIGRTFSSFFGQKSSRNDFILLLNACFTFISEKEKQSSESETEIFKCLLNCINLNVLGTDYKKDADIFWDLRKIIIKFIQNTEYSDILIFQLRKMDPPSYSNEFNLQQHIDYAKDIICNNWLTNIKFSG
jgi:hypothetical protein